MAEPGQPQRQPHVPATPLPRVTIQYCTQCKWMLRAAYFAQELLSTFSLSLGEVALQPATGGTFRIHLTTLPTALPSPLSPATTLIWDRQTDGGFPEVKELKRRVRDVIDPDRDLGHVDRGKSKGSKDVQTAPATTEVGEVQAGEIEQQQQQQLNEKPVTESRDVGKEPGMSAVECEDCK